MRKILLAVVLIAAGAFCGARAQSRLTDADTRLLDECRTLFIQRDFTAAAPLLDEWARIISPKGQGTTEEIDFMRTVIAAETDPGKAMPAIQQFMDRYPNSIYSNRMMSLLGSAHFANHDYKGAIECFDGTDPILLDDQDCCRMVRQNAIALMRSGRVDEGFVMLNILKNMIDDPQSDPDVVFYNAYVDYVNGNSASAREGFENSLESDHAEEALLYLADLDLRGDGDHRVARQTAESMIAGSDDPVIEAEAERILGEYWFGRSDWAKAQDLLTSYLAQDVSQDVRYDRYLLGLACFNNSDMDGAIENLSTVVTDDDRMTQNACLHIGLAALRKGDKNLARIQFERAASLPGDASISEQALYNYAMVIHETAYSPFAESVKSFERFLNEYPGSKYAEKVSSYLVDVYLSTPSYDAALESIDKIKSPGASILAAKMQLLYNKAMDLMASGQYDDVPELLSSVIALDRYDHEMALDATFWRGEAYFRLSDPAHAEADYLRFRNTSGNVYSRNYSLANYGLGYIMYDRKAYREALYYFNYVVADGNRTGISDEIRADAGMRMADCHFFERNYDQAKDFYALAMNIGSNAGDYALYQTALVNGLQRNYYQKIQDLERLINGYPASSYVASALYEQGRAYQQTDNPEKAVGAFGRIITDYPTSDLARKAAVESALIYYQTDRYDEALKAYKEVIAKYPGSDEARTALVDLKSIYVDRGDVNSYIDYISTVQGAAPIAVSERDSLSYAAAEGLFSRGQKAEAKLRLAEYLFQFPNGAFTMNALYYQGLLLEEENDYDKAYESFMRVAANGNNRFSESALDHAASMAWNVGDWETAMDTYIRLYDKTADAERQRRSLYCIVSSAGKIEEYDAVLLYADKALNAQLPQDQRTEVSFRKAKALIHTGKTGAARPLLEELSKDTRSQYGAESDYLLSQLLYDSGDKEGAEKVIMAFIKEGTPHMYWLARSFILLSDIYRSQGKDVEARQYLISLRNNYTEKDDIADMIAARLE